MVCGLCHREPQDHTESTSGPTRCEYASHRENCPGGFRTSCDQLKENLETTDEKKTETKEDLTIDKLALDLSALNLTATPDPQAMVNQLQQLLVQLKGTQQASSLSVPENQNYSEILSSLAHLFKTPGRTADPAPQQAQQVAQPAETGSVPVTPKVTGLEKLAREHIAENQPFLEKQQLETNYTGPTISTIRQDKPTQAKVQQVIDALKHISPVFGQPGTPVPQVLPGISPLDQLKQQLSSQANQLPASFPPPQLKHPQDVFQQLGDLLNLNSGQIPLNQPTQPVGHFPTAAQPPLYVQQPLYSQPPLHPQPSPHQQLQTQLSQLLTSLQGVPPLQVNPTPFIPAAPAQQMVAPPTQLLSWAQLQQMPATQLLQHPELLQQLMLSATQPSQLLQPGLMEVPQQKASQQAQPAQLLQGMSRPRAMHVRPTEYSRLCQVEYSEKVKADNANLVMFCFGYVSQILASRQGHIAQMSDTEINGRLQHLLHLLELTAMFSANSDYSSYAWHRARNYNARIFSDLDHGNTTWSRITSKMDPTSMMQAIEAVPKEYKRKEVRDPEKKKGDDASPCPKWNTCEVQGKCSYEVDNPGKTCNRLHICSYCYTKFGHTKTNHKESSCRKKDDGDSASGTGSQPTR